MVGYPTIFKHGSQTTPPKPDKVAEERMKAKLGVLLAKYRTEMVS